MRHITVLLMGLAVFLAACGRQGEPPSAPARQVVPGSAATGPARAPAGAKTEPARAEVPLGTNDPQTWGQLPFKIEKIYPKQQPTPQAPRHRDGGDWTFMDCMAGSGADAVRFTVGVQAGPAATEPMTWGKATLSTRDTVAGDAFLHRFAAAFHTTTPKVVFHNPYPLLIDSQTMKMNYAGPGTLGGNVHFAPGFRFAAIQSDAELQIAPVVGAGD